MKQLARYSAIAALIAAPLGGEVAGRHALVWFYSTNLYSLDNHSLIIASWGLATAVSLLTLTISLVLAAPLVKGRPPLAGVCNALSFIALSVAPPIAALLVALSGLAAPSPGLTYSAASAATLLSTLALVPSAVIASASEGRLSMPYVLVTGTVVGATSSFISSLAGFAVAMASPATPTTISPLGLISEAFLPAVAAQILAYEVSLLTLASLVTRR